MNIKKPSEKLIFWTLVSLFMGLCFIVRIRGLNYQLPDLAYGDEHAVAGAVFSALEKGDLTLLQGKHSFWYAPFYSYILAVTSLITIKLSSIFGWFSSINTFPVWVVYLIGRWISIIFSVATIFVVFKISKDFFDLRIGAIASLFMIITPYHIISSYYAKPDTLLVFLCLISFYFTLKISKTGQKKFYFWASFFWGLGLATKLLALGFVVPILFVFVLTEYQSNLNLGLRIRRLLINRYLAMIFLGGVVGYLIGNPQVLFHPIQFYTDIMNNLFGVYVIKSITKLEDVKISIPWFFNIYYSLLNPKYILFISFAGLIVLLKKNWRWGFIFMLTIISVQVFILPATLAYGSVHHYLSIAPLFYLLAGFFFIFLLNSLSFNKKLYKYAGFLLFLFFILFASLKWVPDAAKAADFVSGMKTETRDNDPRRWILSNIEPGSKFLMQKSSNWPFLSEKIYEIHSDVDTSATFFENIKGYDYLILHTYRAHDGDFLKYSADIEKLVPVKQFERTSKFRLGFEIFDIKNKTELDHSQKFSFQLEAEDLKFNDFAGIETAFFPKKGKSYTLKAKIFDGYSPKDFKGWLVQRILIDDLEVLRHDLGDESGTGWNDVEMKIPFTNNQIKIRIEVRAVSKSITAGWADASGTIGSVQLLRDDQPVDLHWTYTGNNGSEKKFNTFYTKTLFPFEKRELPINNPSFDLGELKKSWAFKYRVNDQDNYLLKTFWLSIGIPYQNNLVEMSKSVVLDGTHSLHIVASGCSEDKKKSIIVGQVIPREFKDYLSRFSAHYYLPSEESKGGNFRILLHILAESLGGRYLKKKTYIIHESNSDEKQQHNQWLSYNINIKKDFTHPFIRWSDVEFITLSIELENTGEQNVGIYIDNLIADYSPK
ncbi:hypothetical protein LCGC14_0800200 [marine sediment metagenome]|uniref:Glycosyltransferase RgtA/B/C/D-like domain-containing protein n=1 Tax=marine sediment metagenome TaxID=412755 RepID=A0A0F9Q9T4_9ZZZZ